MFARQPQPHKTQCEAAVNKGPVGEGEMRGDPHSPGRLGYWALGSVPYCSTLRNLSNQALFGNLTGANSHHTGALRPISPRKTLEDATLSAHTRSKRWRQKGTNRTDLRAANPIGRKRPGRRRRAAAQARAAERARAAEQAAERAATRA